MTVILITGVADFVLLPDKQKERDWLAKDYLLKIVKVTENIQIPFFDSISILFKLWGVLTKLGYAFLYQE